jgi:hypothetical protein
VAVDYTIDTNKRVVKDKVNKAEPRMSEWGILNGLLFRR